MITYVVTSSGATRGNFRDAFGLAAHLGETTDGRAPLLTIGPDMGAMFLTHEQATDLYDAIGHWLERGKLPAPERKRA